jgi:hypothetical protein
MSDGNSMNYRLIIHIGKYNPIICEELSLGSQGLRDILSVRQRIVLCLNYMRQTHTHPSGSILGSLYRFFDCISRKVRRNDGLVGLC